MKNQENSQSVKKFLSWRENLYHGLKARKETLIELLDALSVNQTANSVVELSINPHSAQHNCIMRGYKTISI